MDAVFTVDQIRRAEQPLLDAQDEPDDLMRRAARAVADAAEVMLAAPKPYFLGRHATRVLLLVGSGGNGGDALYAGALLAAAGRDVDAVLTGQSPNPRAVNAFVEAGGNVLKDGRPDLAGGAAHGDPDYPGPESLDPARPEDAGPWEYELVIDGIAGIGGSGGLRENAARLVRCAQRAHARFLAIDVPSGVAADTGAAAPGTAIADPERDDEPGPGGTRTIELPGHVTADVTVTFGGLRFAHALSGACGEVVVADIALPKDSPEGVFTPPEDLPDGAVPGRTLHGELHSVLEADVTGAGQGWTRYHSVVPAPGSPYEWPTLFDINPVDVWAIDGGEPPRPPHPAFPSDLEPSADDDKYSGGVVGICAGGEHYPGAGVLTATAAVRATPAMVRYVGSCSAEVVRALPEVVAHPSLADAGRVDAWVFGPGRGTDDAAAAELAELLGRGEPLLIDADGITLLAERPELREALSSRADDGRATLLTPHAGEFGRLAAALGAPGDAVDGGGIPDPADDRIGAVTALASALRCAVLLKGRVTVIADPGPNGSAAGGPNPVDDAPAGKVRIVDAGTSWAATPGSGDVLSGIAGAWLARDGMAGVLPAVTVQARASEIAARTPAGYAPTSASLIAGAIREATAALSSGTRWPRFRDRT